MLQRTSVDVGKASLHPSVPPLRPPGLEEEEDTQLRGTLTSAEGVSARTT